MEREAIEDLFAPIARVRFKRLFSGHGIYLDEMIFALRIQGEIYLKTDAETVDAFAAAGSRPFSHARPGRVVETSYCRMPDACFDDEEALRHWCALALAAARRKAARGQRKVPARSARTR